MKFAVYSKVNSPQAEEYYVWEFPGAPVKIHLSLDVVSRLGAEVERAFKPASGSVEIGGILLGRVLRDGSGVVEIDDYEAVICESRSNNRYILAGVDRRKLEKAVTKWKSGSGNSVAGFFRSHLRPDLGLDAEDLSLMRAYFSDPNDVSLLVKPRDTGAPTAGFFFWQDGQIHARFSLLEFPFESDKLSKVGGSMELDPALDWVKATASGRPGPAAPPLAQTASAPGPSRAAVPFLSNRSHGTAVPAGAPSKPADPPATTIPNGNRTGAVPAIKAAAPAQPVPLTGPPPSQAASARPVTPFIPAKSPAIASQPAAPQPVNGTATTSVPARVTPESRAPSESRAPFGNTGAAVPAPDKAAPPAVPASPPVQPAKPSARSLSAPTPQTPAPFHPAPQLTPANRGPYTTPAPTRPLSTPVKPAQTDPGNPGPQTAPVSRAQTAPHNPTQTAHVSPAQNAPFTPGLQTAPLKPAQIIPDKPTQTAPVRPVQTAPVKPPPQTNPLKPAAQTKSAAAAPVLPAAPDNARAAKRTSLFGVAADPQDPDPVETGWVGKIGRKRLAIGGAAFIAILASVAGLQFHGSAGDTALALKVNRTAQGYKVNWNPNTALFAKAEGGLLSIRDGNFQKDLYLDSAQLHGGEAMYPPSNNDVSFRLDVFASGEKKNVTESVLIPAQAAPAAGAPQGAELPPLAQTNALPLTQQSPARGAAPAPSPAGGLEPAVTGLNNQQSSAVIAKPMFRPPASRTGAEASVKLEVPEPLATPVVSMPAQPIVASPAIAAPPPVAPPAPRVEQPVRAENLTGTSSTPVQKPAAEMPVPPRAAPAVAAALPPSKLPEQTPANYVAPRSMSKVQPVVPQNMKSLMHGEMQIDVRVSIDASGKVTGAIPMSAKGQVGNYLGGLAANSARLWKFIPATSSGKNVPSEIVLRFRF